MDNQYYQVNSAEVASKALDGEVLVINLHNGCYYSMDGPAVLAWVMLDQGCSLARCAEALVQRWGIASQQAESDLSHWVQQLRNERILLPVQGARTEAQFDPSLHPQSLGELPGTYTAPQLTVFDDMSDLLALDPPMPKILVP